jgi:hypothetical protein
MQMREISRAMDPAKGTEYRAFTPHQADGSYWQ